MEPGANPPVDEYPILKLIPRRFAFWKRRAILAGATMDSVWGEAVARVKKRRAGETGEIVSLIPYLINGARTTCQ